MAESAKKVAAWIEAHPQLKIPEDVLATCGPWPSLEATDFLVWAREREEFPDIALKMVADLLQEVNWAYAGWTKAASTDAPALLRDLMANASGADEYNFTRRFLQDYAKAHGMSAEPPKEEVIPPWRQATETGAVPVPRPQLSREAVAAGNVEPPKPKTRTATRKKR